LLSFCDALTGQIQLSGKPIVKNVQCQRSELGSIQVNVKTTHPPYTFTWNDGQASEKIINLETGNYSVIIKDALGSDTTLHFTIDEVQCMLTPELFFTPNGDGINDVWGISYAQYFPDALILVYNRLGQLVYQKSGIYDSSSQWDGTDLLGFPLPTSTYFFVVYADKSDHKNIKKGTVSIVR
jgi:gliding motility-associated-like protein